MVTGPLLSNSAALLQPDENDCIVLRGVVGGLAAAVGAEAFPGVAAGIDAAVEHWGHEPEPVADALRYLEALKQEFVVLIAIGSPGETSLDRAGRNALRTICHLLLARPLAFTAALRYAEQLLEAIGPWYEPAAEAA